jgi:hypothetical protein
VIRGRATRLPLLHLILAKAMDLLLATGLLAMVLLMVEKVIQVHMDILLQVLMAILLQVHMATLHLLEFHQDLMAILLQDMDMATLHQGMAHRQRQARATQAKGILMLHLLAILPHLLVIHTEQFLEHLQMAILAHHLVIIRTHCHLALRVLLEHHHHLVRLVLLGLLAPQLLDLQVITEMITVVVMVIATLEAVPQHFMLVACRSLQKREMSAMLLKDSAYLWIRLLYLTTGMQESQKVLHL